MNLEQGKFNFQGLSPNVSAPDCDLFLELNQISCKACEYDVRRRYSTAGLMQADLQAVLDRLSRELRRDSGKTIG